MPRTDDIYETAFHEAGHAVVGFLLGIKFKQEAITIIPDAELSGCVAFDEHGIQGRDDLCTAFAGLLAQAFTARTDGVGKRLAADATVDIRSALRALVWISKGKRKRIIRAFLASCLPIAEANKFKPYLTFRNQFFEALRQSHMQEPKSIRGDRVILRELHTAAHKARLLLTNNIHLLNALGHHLLTVKKMTAVELTAFLESFSRSEKR
jgi:hypothetical protein